MSAHRVPVTRDDHILGPQESRVTLVEYGDYQCPHCRLAHPIVQRVRTELGSQLRYVFRHFPLSQIHPLAEPAAESAEFAGAHARFWEMHDGIYENQDRLGVPLLLALAEILGLPERELDHALETGKYSDKVRQDFMGGVRSGVNGTPAFFINGERHVGGYAFGDLIAAVRMHMQDKVPT
jgi:protein-disulfide isomerase